LQKNIFLKIISEVHVKIKYLFPVLLFISTVFIHAQEKKQILGYYPGWKGHVNSYLVKTIEACGSADKLTIINYAFAQPRPDSTGRVVVFMNHPESDYYDVYTAQLSIDGIADDSTQALRGNFNQLKKLKARHPGLKVVISIGGWGGSTWFSDAALTPESRETFVNSCIETFIKGNLPLLKDAGGKGAAAGLFDGIDIDWEYPVSDGPEGMHYNEKDKENLTELFALFRKKLDEVRPGLILSTAVPAVESIMGNFNFTEDQKYLDFICLMSYDLAGVWDSTTAHHTNLFSHPDPVRNRKFDSYDRGVRILTEQYKVDSRKILGGAAFYGKGWEKTLPGNNGLFQPGKFGGKAAGYNAYNTLMVHTRNYGYSWDDIAMAPYLYNSDDSTFFTYDDPQSVALKSRYADAYNLGGVFFWDLSGDDLNGTLVNSIFTRNMPDISYGSYPSAEAPDIKLLPAVQREGNTDIIIKTQPNSSVKKVEFFVNDISIGYDTKAPFSWVWFNAPEGEHTIKAAAVNLNGKTKTVSEKITVKRKQ
jgi:chitinase